MNVHPITPTATATATATVTATANGTATAAADTKLVVSLALVTPLILSPLSPSCCVDSSCESKNMVLHVLKPGSHRWPEQSLVVVVVTIIVMVIATTIAAATAAVAADE